MKKKYLVKVSWTEDREEEIYCDDPSDAWDEIEVMCGKTLKCATHLNTEVISVETNFDEPAYDDK